MEVEFINWMIQTTEIMRYYANGIPMCYALILIYTKQDKGVKDGNK